MARRITYGGLSITKVGLVADRRASLAMARREVPLVAGRAFDSVWHSPPIADAQALARRCMASDYQDCDWFWCVGDDYGRFRRVRGGLLQ